ncbi:MAG: DUF3794 domain-containing protein [Oscillospiraceae bacterium]|nr:DUF3794 domain-containing protein [Oscillospiraceae bacterium]
MELMLEKKRMERFEHIFCESTIHDENIEMIIPDRSPDVLRIVKGSADAFVKDKNVRDGKVDIGGNIKGVVLYIAEGENEVRKLDVTMPFAYVIDAKGAKPGIKLQVRTELRSFDVHEINPRKISVRANVEVSVCGYEPGSAEICMDISDGAKEGIYIKKRPISLYQPTRIHEKSFTISDDLELVGEVCDLSAILSSNVNLVPTDTKIIGNKSILKGVAEISYVYKLTDGNVASGECELPFSHILDIEGMREDDDLKTYITVSGFELEPQYDATGKARYMTVNIGAEVQSFVWSKEDAEILDDIYSTKGKINTRTENVRCISFCDRIEKRVPITESIEAQNGIKRVLDVAVKVSRPLRRREGADEKLLCDAFVNVMYIGEDDAVYNALRRKTVECPLELLPTRAYEASAYVRGKGYSVGAGNEINVRFFTDFDITETNEITVAAMSTITVEDEEQKAKGFGVTVMRLDRDCDIWSLAKENMSTIEEIKLANGITDEKMLGAGRMVLVPGKR